MGNRKATANASHILVKTETECNDIINQLKEGADFAELAKKYSSCPSKQNGGDLGNFSQGMMVPEFDHVIFDENNMGLYPQPVKTQFGWHVIDIKSRDA